MFCFLYFLSGWKITLTWIHVSSLFFKKTSTFSKAINVLKHLEGVRTCAPGRVVLWRLMNREFWTTWCDLMKSHFCWVILLTYDPEMFEDMIVFEKKNDLNSWLGMSSFPATSIMNACKWRSSTSQDAECHPSNRPQATYRMMTYPNGQEQWPKMHRRFWPDSVLGCQRWDEFHGRFVSSRGWRKSLYGCIPFWEEKMIQLVFFLPLVEGIDVIWMTLKREGYTHILMMGLYTPKSVVVHCEYGGWSCIHPGIVGKQADHGFGFHSSSAAFSTSADAETMIKADKVHLWR